MEARRKLAIREALGKICLQKKVSLLSNLATGESLCI